MKIDKNMIILVMGIILNFILLLVGLWLCVIMPIQINRTVHYTTHAMTFDGVKVTIKWDAVYRAPIFLPVEDKFSAATQIETYGMIRLRWFIIKRSAYELKNMSSKDFQTKFNDDDVVKEVSAFLSDDVINKIKRIKTVKIKSIEYEKAFVDMLKKRDNAKHELDSIRRKVFENITK